MSIEQEQDGGALVVPGGRSDAGSGVASSGRDGAGRFTAGGAAAAAASSLSARVRFWRGKLLATVHGGDVEQVYRELLSACLDRAGPRRDQLAAIRLWLEYVAGKPEPAGDVEPGAGRGGFVFRFSGPVLLAGGVDQVRGGEPVAGLSAELVAGGGGDLRGDELQAGPALDLEPPPADELELAGIVGADDDRDPARPPAGGELAKPRAILAKLGDGGGRIGIDRANHPSRPRNAAC